MASANLQPSEMAKVDEEVQVDKADDDAKSLQVSKVQQEGQTTEEKPSEADFLPPNDEPAAE